jgi:hypothetical protein
MSADIASKTRTMAYYRIRLKKGAKNVIAASIECLVVNLCVCIREMGS